MSVLRLLTSAALCIAGFAIVPGLFVIAREAFRRMRERRAAMLRSSLRDALSALQGKPMDEIARAIARSFDKATIQAVLEEEAELDHAPSVELYELLGLCAKWERALRQGRTWTERAHAARMLGKLGVASVTPWLVASISDPEEDTTVRLAASEAISSIRDDAALPWLCRALAEQSESSAPCIAEAIVSFGATAVEPLLPLLSDARVATRTWTARVLGRIGDSSAAEALVARFGDASIFVRVAVAEALGRIGDPQASQALACAALSDPSASVRARAALSLATSPDPEAVFALCAGLGDTDAEVRGAAVEALVALRPADPSPIERALFDPCEDSRRGAAVALDRLGAVSKWTASLGDPSTESRAAARTALAAVARAGLSESITSALKHDDAAVRAGICGVLGDLGSPRYVPLLAKALADDASLVQHAAALALGRVGGEAALAVFSQEKPPGLPDDTWAMARAQAEASILKKDEAPSFKARWLSEARRGAKMGERIRAILELSDHASPESTAALAEALVSDPSPEVRALAARQLSRVEERWLSVPALVRALSDPAKDVAEAAKKALAAAPAAEDTKGRRSSEAPASDGNGSARRTTGRFRRAEVTEEVA